jgi:hypothetical protein
MQLSILRRVFLGFGRRRADRTSDWKLTGVVTRKVGRSSAEAALYRVKG